MQSSLPSSTRNPKNSTRYTRIPSSSISPTRSDVPHHHQDAEIDRILQAFKLDAYAVLDLQPGVPDSDIKICYRKKSLLIHPDKSSNPAAPDAFDRLKKAQTELLDEKHRARLDEAIADARMLLIRQHKWTVDSPELQAAWFRAEWRDKTREVLIDGELRRRKQMKAQMQEEGRQQRKEEEEMQERKRKREHEAAWEQSRDQRVGSWRDFQKGKGGGAEGEGKKKKKKLKPIG
jgi:DnaJ homolog subfamily C member 8